MAKAWRTKVPSEISPGMARTCHRCGSFSSEFFSFSIFSATYGFIIQRSIFNSHLVNDNDNSHPLNQWIIYIYHNFHNDHRPNHDLLFHDLLFRFHSDNQFSRRRCFSTAPAAALGVQKGRSWIPGKYILYKYHNNIHSVSRSIGQYSTLYMYMYIGDVYGLHIYTHTCHTYII